MNRLSLSHRYERRSVLPSVGAVAVIVGVVVANGWSMWHASPDLAPMDPMARLSTLKDANEAAANDSAAKDAALPETALAMGPNGQYAAGARVDAVLGKAQPTIKLTSTRSTPGGQPENPRGQNQNAVSRSVLVEQGESLSVALSRLFIHGETARKVVAAYSQLRNPQKLQAGWRLWARFDTAGVMDASALQTLVIAPSHAEGLTIQRTTEGFEASEGGLPGTVVRTALRCGIIGTLETSLRRCGEGEGLVELLQPMLTDRLLKPIELHTGDELRIVLDKLVDGDHVERYLGVAALEHRSVLKPRDGKTVALNFHGDLYAPDGEGLEPLFLRQPLQVGHQTSNFGIRMHPILHKMKAHFGVDFAAAVGTPVYAAGDGHLVSAERAGNAGNVVRLRHDGGYLTEYMHLQRFVAAVKPGDVVHKGQVVGFVGSTGLSTGPHLHFGVKHNAKYLDPATLGDVVQPSVQAHERTAFDSESKTLLDLLAALGRGLGDGA